MSECNTSMAEEPEFERIIGGLRILCERFNDINNRVLRINELLIGRLAESPVINNVDDELNSPYPFVVDCSNLIALLQEHATDLDASTTRLLKQIKRAE